MNQIEVLIILGFNTTVDEPHFVVDALYRNRGSLGHQPLVLIFGVLLYI